MVQSGLGSCLHLWQVSSCTAGHSLTAGNGTADCIMLDAGAIVSVLFKTYI